LTLAATRPAGTTGSPWSTFTPRTAMPAARTATTVAATMTTTAIAPGRCATRC
jgi:hypothetical protein